MAFTSYKTPIMQAILRGHEIFLEWTIKVDKTLILGGTKVEGMSSKEPYRFHSQLDVRNAPALSFIPLGVLGRLQL